MDRLCDHYPWAGSSQVAGLSILCLDGDASTASSQSQKAESEFTFTMLMVKLLKAEEIVRLVSCNHGRLHYELVLRKNGLDLARLESSGLLNITYVVSRRSADDCSGSVDWQGLVNMFDGGISDATNVLIDDLDALELLSPNAPSCRELISLVNHRVHSLRDSSGAGVCTLAMYGREVARSGGPVLDDDGQPPLSEWFRDGADIVVHSKNLASGYSRYPLHISPFSQY